ncbi:MAG: NAD(P)-binding protein [Thermodesulfobacteriota bacterium]
MPRKTVHIAGAGLAGMVAAINLAREGFEVVVRDREEAIGGSKKYHPSIHTTPLQPEETWKYIGIDLAEHFVRTDEYPPMYYNEKRLKMPAYVDNLSAYNVERGSRPTSIDTRLFGLAVKEGVEFEFKKELSPDSLRALPPGSIVATGLYRGMYETMGIKSAPVHGVMALSGKEEGRAGGAIYMGSFSVDYAYSAWINGLMYVLLFSRKPISDKQLQRFRKVMEKVEGFSSDKWVRVETGLFPRQCGLFREDKILAGTLAGMIEPFWGYGVVGALLSGKIAALAVTDRENAEAEFARFNGGFARKLARKEKMDAMPFRKQLLRLAIIKARFDCWRRPELKNAAKDPVVWFR